ncbi:MAG: 16S rRNA (guanine(966)-N(2))-methyltransferase RsmD [Cyanobacteria bacterium]|nr:16S rRNA (guanine(966)-N(2))-methyltransferase RsmD [Cyanobacteriota bacterium]MDA0865298.1 16S rRNA (guanine(966)-N(2))-methyltransferase RsmD [Cyanobacteriota bacterium]
MALRIYGNRLLKTLPGDKTRPTTGRVREAIFNICQGAIAGTRWLDLCAGNGSMGAEALCRGAGAVVGIEQSGQACQVIRHNWQMVAQGDQRHQVIRGDVRTKLAGLVGQQFDYIYFDPPYGSGLYGPVLGAIARYQLLHPNGTLIVEHSPDQWQATDLPGLMLFRQKAYGHTHLAFYTL